MSYIDQTVLTAYQDKAVSNEIRIPQYGLIDAAQASTKEMPYMSAELMEAVAQAQSRDVKIPQLAESVITTSTVESFTIPTNLSESEMETLSLITVFAGFAMYPETFKNNVISEEAYKMNKIMEVDKAIAKKVEDYIYTHLDTYKSRILPNTTGVVDGFTFQAAIDTLEVSKAAQKDVMFANLTQVVAASNDWDLGNMRMASTYGINAIVNEYAKYGAGNEKNLQFQGLPEMHYSNRVALTSGRAWTAFLLEAGAIGILPSYKEPFLRGVSVGEAKWGISSGVMPQLKDRVMLYENKEKANATGVGANASTMIMSWKEEYGFIYRFALLKRYVSDRDNKVGHIIKIDGLTS
jgi:hypothetical protein